VESRWEHLDRKVKERPSRQKLLFYYRKPELQPLALM
jgi:hypothetical protein